MRNWFCSQPQAPGKAPVVTAQRFSDRLEQQTVPVEGKTRKAPQGFTGSRYRSKHNNAQKAAKPETATTIWLMFTAGISTAQLQHILLVLIPNLEKCWRVILCWLILIWQVDTHGSNSVLGSFVMLCYVMYVCLYVLYCIVWYGIVFYCMVCYCILLYGMVLYCYESQPRSWLVAICERSENRGSGGWTSRVVPKSRN